MLKEELRHTHFPYCIQRQEDGTYVFTNRNYKPIGFMTGGWVNYDDSPIGVKISELTPTLAARLDHKGRDNLDRIYLYGDSCVPTADQKYMDAYLGRLGILMKLRIAD
ncbi:hypothetical protein [Pseudomonas sp. 8(2025)]|uniref:hypothetical protein n=1 Tax=Pseudomonas sp. 8(2025) TaxID=3456022 RepID=UPI004044BA0B